ncbi:MAG TPA: tRNA dihydrouridine synthase DusB [Gammaproteobacteria bacterium]|nr:tRNA dihydrouridine synthase DusB [Gammaproteobacteria bacterium]
MNNLLKPLQIGPYRSHNNLVLAPMAGVTDLPFRLLCKKLGAGMAVSEMVASNPDTRGTTKSTMRTNFELETAPVSVQIVGHDPAIMANAARYNVELGAQIIDINMGCPAKKVCRKLAGSALLADEALVEKILYAVTQAVSVPVTLKIRTGTTATRRNAVQIARIAEAAGIQLLAIHGRTREARFSGTAEHDTTRAVCQSVSIPVLANGDIHTPQQAQDVLKYTGAAGLMIGRAAQGNPWIFREISHFLINGKLRNRPSAEEVLSTLSGHLRSLHAFYGEQAGVRIARKHIGWYLQAMGQNRQDRAKINTIETSAAQLNAVREVLEKHQHRKQYAA